MKNKIGKSLALITLIALPMTGQAGAGNHHAAVFLGGTNGAKDTDPTLGVEYEYRTPLWDKKIGVGVIAERIFGSKYDADLFLAGVIVHPWKGSKFNLSAGKEFLPSKNKNVLRVGVGYDFYYKNFSYGPIYNLDRIDGNTAHVFGVVLGVGF